MGPRFKGIESKAKARFRRELASKLTEAAQKFQRRQKLKKREKEHLHGDLPKDHKPVVSDAFFVDRKKFDAWVEREWKHMFPNGNKKRPRRDSTSAVKDSGRGVLRTIAEAFRFSVARRSDDSSGEKPKDSQEREEQSKPTKNIKRESVFGTGSIREKQAQPSSSEIKRNRKTSDTRRESEKRQRDIIEVKTYRSGFGEGKSQSEVTNRVVKSRRTIMKAFRETRREPHPHGTTGIDEAVYRLYFKEGLSQQKVAERLGFKTSQPVRRVFKERGWNPRRERHNLLARKDIRDDEVRQLYFDEGLTQKEAAEKLNASLHTIRKVFREHGWKVRQRVEVEHNKETRRSMRKHSRAEEYVPRLCFDEGLTQREAAQKLGVSEDEIRGVFRKKGWETRLDPRKKSIDAEEVRRLYFDEGFSQQEVAEKLGFTSASPIRRIFRENGWKPRRDRTGISMRFFESKEERELARTEARRATTQRIKELRDAIFGAECRICGLSKDERTLVIHRKDGAEHGTNALWGISTLKSLNPDEWAALCIPCHRGVHWLMSETGINWDTIESRLEKQQRFNPTTRETLGFPDDDAPSSSKYKEIAHHFEGRRTRDLRRALFGENCHLCGVHYKEKRLATHRKDGRMHGSKLLESKKYLRTLDPNDWVSLCQKCHHYVHWAMDTLDMNWEDLESAINWNS